MVAVAKIVQTNFQYEIRSITIVRSQPSDTPLTAALLEVGENKNFAIFLENKNRPKQIYIMRVAHYYAPKTAN